MLTQTFLEKLRCPLCGGAFEAKAAAIACRGCGRARPLDDGPPDFLPERVKAALSGGAAPAPWRAWREVEAALNRWRRGRAGNAAATEADRERLRRFVDFARLTGELLDVGCKDGHLARYLPAGAAFAGIEPEPTKKAADDIVRGVGEELPFADASFDAVLYLASFDYLVEPARAVDEAARVLRRGGRLVMLQTVRPGAVAAAMRARGPGALLAALTPGAIAALGLMGALRAARDGLLPGRRCHVGYYEERDLGALLSPRFTIARRSFEGGGVLFLEARKREET
jgi:SAM-dependent methyltransferase